MNKKLMAGVLIITLGVVMLVTTAFASFSGSSGYDTYKTAIKNMMEVKSFTGNIQVSVTDNGKELTSLDSKVKMNNSIEEKISSSTVIKTVDTQKSFDLFVQNGKAVLKANDSDVYNVFENDFNHNGDKEVNRNNPESMKAGEMLIDAFVGNLKNYFITTENTTGEKQIKVQLSDNQIPTWINTLTSLAIKNHETKEMNLHQNVLDLGEDFNVALPELTEDIRIDNISLTAVINKDNQIKNQIINITLSGKDAEAKKHTLNLSINLALSDLNSTTPDVVDLTGKNIKTIDKAELESLRAENQK